MRAYRRMLVVLGRFRWFSWLTYTLFVPLDRALYKRSGGRLSVAHVGVRRPGALQTLLLTTTGRKSGEPRSTPVLYLEDGDRLVVVASNFGREHHPAWSANLLADPRATVRIRNHERSVVAASNRRREAGPLAAVTQVVSDLGDLHPSDRPKLPRRLP